MMHHFQSLPLRSLLARQNLCLALLLCAPTTQALSQPELVGTDLTSALELEQRIKEQVNQGLELFLDVRDYRVLVTANVARFRERVEVEGETEQKSAGAEDVRSAEQNLPGFVVPEARTAASTKQIDRKEKSRFAVTEQTRVVSVNLRLVLDEALPESVRSLAHSTAKDTLLQAVGNVGTTEVVTMNLRELSAYGSLTDWLAQYLRQRSSSAVDLLYLVLLVLGFIATLFALIHYFRNKKQLKGTGLTSKALSGDTMDSQALEAACNQQIDLLVSCLNQQPMVTRNFLRLLNEPEKLTLLNTMQTPAMIDVFARILHINPASIWRGSPTPTTLESLSRMMKDLKRYIDLHADMEQKPFGYLPQLPGSELATFVAAEQEKPAILQALAPYLNPTQVSEVIKALSVEEKTDFLAAIHAGTSASDSPSERLAQLNLDQRLRELYDSCKASAVVDRYDQQVMETVFLDSDPESIDVIRFLAKKYGKVPSHYEKYLVTFEDFLGLDLGLTKRVFQKVSNDIVVRALADRNLDDRMKTMLGDLRSQLIASMRQREANLSPEDVEAAKKEVLRIYRSLA